MTFNVVIPTSLFGDPDRVPPGGARRWCSGGTGWLTLTLSALESAHGHSRLDLLCGANELMVVE